jgi:hypothetical protein
MDPDAGGWWATVSALVGVLGAALLFVVYGMLTFRRSCFGCSLRVICDSDRVNESTGVPGEEERTTDGLSDENARP